MQARIGTTKDSVTFGKPKFLSLVKEDGGSIGHLGVSTQRTMLKLESVSVQREDLGNSNKSRKVTVKRN